MAVDLDVSLDEVLSFEYLLVQMSVGPYHSVHLKCTSDTTRSPVFSVEEIHDLVSLIQ